MTDNAQRASESKRPASNVDTAIDHARRGFHVFPIADGTKDKPLVRWSKEATTDEAKIHGWWRKWPMANVGVATGPSGLLVVDVDNRDGKDGNGSLDDLELMWGDLPKTLTAVTASGGRHIYLLGSSRNSVCKLGLGLDVRSAGGYVVAPGSRLDAGGDYRWETEAPVAEAPTWLVEAASAPKRTEYPAGAGAGDVSPSHLELMLSELDPSDYREHERWLELMMACHHATAGEGREEFIEWSTNDPPYADHAHKIRDRWNSLSADPTGRRPVTKRTLFDALNKKIGYVPHCDPSEDFEPIEVDAEIEVETGPRRSRFRVFRPSELLARPKPRWLVEGMLVEGELAVVYGPPKAGKTFLVLDLALSVATGAEFHGGREVGAPGPVLYVIGEGNDELFGERVKAWCDARGLPLPDDGFLAVADRPDVTNPEHVADLAAITRPKLIILDTLSRTMVGDENSPSDMAAYVRGCDRLREVTGAAVVVVHHEGKDSTRGPMGHTKLRGALDTAIRVHRGKNDGSVWVDMVDQRNGPCDLSLNFCIDGQVLTLLGQGASGETPEGDFLDGDDLVKRVCRVAAGMAGTGKGKVVEAVMTEFRWSRMKARRELDKAVPTGRSPDCAIEFEGGQLWFETPDTDHPSPPATARFERSVSDP
jgi:AAA domain/Bifunctional DNA primase/polymerase, N-terminal/Primase C terminal 2 (PriCT-2)